LALRFCFRFAPFCALALLAGPAAAQPVRTWGGEKTPAEGEATTEPKPPPAEPAPTPPPPAPPPSAGPALAEAEPETEAATERVIVRTPGRVGLRYTLEGIDVRGNTSTLSRVVLRQVRFKPGDTLDVDDRELELTRFRLLGTGFFSDVQLSLRRGSRRGYVVLVVRVVERNTIVVNDFRLGLSADAEPNGAARPLTAYGGVDVSENNLAGTGIKLGGALAVADRQLGLRTRFAEPQLFGSPWSVEAQVLFNRARDFFGNRDVLVEDATPTGRVQDFAVVSYSRFGGQMGVGHDVSLTSRVFFDYRLESIDATLPLAASHRRGRDIEPIEFYIHNGNSILSTVRATLLHDTRDEPFLPTRGVYVTAQAEASLTPIGSDYPYSRIQLQGSKWMSLPWGHVLRLEGFGGAIIGDAPLFERFYVGDLTDLLPDRYLDLAFDRRAAPNFLDTMVVENRYGTFAAKVAAEYRVPLYRGRRSIYGIDLFGTFGIYALTTQQDIQVPPRGYEGLRKVPVDLTFNLGLRMDTSVGGFVFGASNLLWLIPFRRDAVQ
jgi:outer membrane protein assembly factor BamA